MWRGHLEALGRYTRPAARSGPSGFGDTVAATVTTELADGGRHHGADPARAGRGRCPAGWLGDEDFHRSHRSALLRKDAAYYQEAFGNVPDDLPYVWPATDAT